MAFKKFFFCKWLLKAFYTYLTSTETQFVSLLLGLFNLFVLFRYVVKCDCYYQEEIMNPFNVKSLHFPNWSVKWAFWELLLCKQVVLTSRAVKNLRQLLRRMKEIKFVKVTSGHFNFVADFTFWHTFGTKKYCNIELRKSFSSK